MGVPAGPDKINRRQRMLNLTLASVAAQAGCLTLVIVLAATFAGIWLDGRFHSRPWFTIGLLIASVPVSVLTMIYVTRLAISKIKTGQSDQAKAHPEEEGFGKN
jgi:F0F1-type ATP synthase assembly protein I